MARPKKGRNESKYTTFNCDSCNKESTRLTCDYDRHIHHFCSEQCVKNYNSKHIVYPYPGEKRGRLTFIEIINGKHIGKLSATYYKCSCVCGSTFFVPVTEWKKVKSCGCLSHSKGFNSPSFRGCGEISLSRWNDIVNGAKTRNYEFTIDIKFAWDLFLKQRKQCALTGIDLNISKAHNEEITASLDRIDSNKGYTPDNVQWVHKIINRIKTDLNINDFRNWCYQVAAKDRRYATKLDFDEVLIRPQITTIESRKDVNLHENYMRDIIPNVIPIIAANFDTVGCFQMAKELMKYQVMTCLHKHYTVDEYINFFNEIKEDKNKIFYSIGTNKQDLDKLQLVYEQCRIPNICLDVAHAESPSVFELIETIKKKYPNSILMVGNIATPDAIETFHNLGVNIVKVGIGSGNVCTTRITAGIGVPQLSAVLDCVEEAKRFNIKICSDGGCRYPADIVKALGCGASMVMIGSMLAGTDECDGTWIKENGQKFLTFYGMSSNTAMKKNGMDLRDYRASEGRTVKIPYKGPVSPIIQQILGGIRSACTYTNSKTLLDLPNNTEFLRVNNTHSTFFENITTHLY